MMTSIVLGPIARKDRQPPSRGVTNFYTQWAEAERMALRKQLAPDKADVRNQVSVEGLTGTEIES